MPIIPMLPFQPPDLRGQLQPGGIIGPTNGLTANPAAGKMNALATLQGVVDKFKEDKAKERDESLKRAMQQIQMAGLGLPVDSKAVKKDLEKAGIPIDFEGQRVQGGGQNPMGGPGPGVAQAVPMGGTMPLPQGSPLPQGMQQQGPPPDAIQRMIMQAQMKQQAERQQMQLGMQEMDLVSKSMSGDWDATMRLAANGKIPNLQDAGVLYEVAKRHGSSPRELTEMLFDQATLPMRNVKQQMEIRANEADDKQKTAIAEYADKLLDRSPLLPQPLAEAYAKAVFLGGNPELLQKYDEVIAKLPSKGQLKNFYDEAEAKLNNSKFALELKKFDLDVAKFRFMQEKDARDWTTEQKKEALASFSQLMSVYDRMQPNMTQDQRAEILAHIVRQKSLPEMVVQNKQRAVWELFDRATDEFGWSIPGVTNAPEKELKIATNPESEALRQATMPRTKSPGPQMSYEDYIRQQNSVDPVLQRLIMQRAMQTPLWQR